MDMIRKQKGESMLRNDFVSNSSASSFIIGFKNNDILNDFVKAFIDDWGKVGKEKITKFLKNKIFTQEDKKDPDSAYRKIDENDKKEYPIVYCGTSRHWACDEIDLFADLLIYHEYEKLYNEACKNNNKNNIGIKILYTWDY